MIPGKKNLGGGLEEEMLIFSLTIEELLGIPNHTGLENHKRQGGACRCKQLREFNYRYQKQGPNSREFR